MYIRGLIPRNSTELAKAVPIDLEHACMVPQIVGGTWYEFYQGIAPVEVPILLEKAELVFSRPSQDTMRVDLKSVLV